MYLLLLVVWTVSVQLFLKLYFYAVFSFINDMCSHFFLDPGFVDIECEQGGPMNNSGSEVSILTLTF